MRKLTILEYMSLDGVVQAPGGPGEDGDYPYGGWSAPFDDPVVDEALGAAQGGPFDLLLGRRTYDIWAGYWPHAPASPVAGAFNAATKFVATHRPDSLGWGPAEHFGPDVAEDVRRIKADGGPNLVLWGSSTLTSVLLENGLADAVVLIVVPVLLGTGKRFFAEGTPPRALKLVRTRIGASGVVINTFEPAGPLRTGTSGQDPN
jgi:dihydrofolate reductase